MILQGAAESKPIRLGYRGAVPIPAQNEQSPPTQARVGENPSEARVHVTSEPSGGEISVDGNFMGDTPSELTVAAGVHTITISKHGYKTWERKLTVSSGKVTVTAELEQ